jgi:hypothetical protein
MAVRRPLVHIEGEIGILPAEDIIEFSPFFSYRRIQANKILIIFDHQQMMMKGDITVDGDLVIEEQGELWQL